jgi:hypothetical protein
VDFVRWVFLLYGLWGAIWEATGPRPRLAVGGAGGMVYDADDEQRLKVMQMHADMDNKMADTAYKQGLLKFEPWKIVISAFAASAAVFGVIGGVLGYFLRGLH